jgi:hypothetical protein
MSFFHNLNKTLDSIAARPEAAQLNEREIKKNGKLEEEGFPRIQAGIQKYTKPGIEKLAKLGREGASKVKMDATRKEFNQYDSKEVDEGLDDVVKKVGGMAKKAGSAVLNKVGHGDDVDMIRDLQDKLGMLQTGEKPEQKKSNLPEADKGDAVEDRKERLAKQIYDLSFNIHQNDGYGQDTSQEQAMLAKLKAEFARLHPGEDAFKIGKALNDREYQQRQQQRNAEFKQNQQASSRSTGIMQKAKNALGGMYEEGLPMVKGPDGKMVPKFAYDNEGPNDLKKSFNDKIAGAKKEVDEMLGDVAAEAMRNALGGRQQVADEGNAFTGALAKTPKGGKFKVGGKEFTDTSSVDEEEDLNPFTNYKKPRADAPKRGEVTRGRHHDIKHDTTDSRYSGMIATRRSDAQGISVGSDTDAEGNTIDKRGRGRPKGPEKGPERTTAKAYKHKGERKVKEGDMEEGADQGQAQQIYNDLADIRAIAKQAQRGGEFPQGYASRLESVLYAAMTMIKNQQSGDAQVREAESTDKKDNRAEKAGKRVAKDIEYDEKKKDGIHGKKRGAEDDKAEKAGKKVSKDIEYDDKKDEVKEDEPKKSKSKFKFGGSVYETLDAQLETLITEGMSVTVNMSQDDEHGEGRKNITVNADGEDADRLAELLKMAGISQQSSGCGCGQSPCGCEMVDENNPNWPSNTEYTSAKQNMDPVSNDLVRNKSTGQSTVPVIAGQEERMGQDDLSRLREMAGMRQNEILDEGIMDKIKGMLVPKLMKLLGPDAEKIASAVKQATGGNLTPSKENAMKVVQALGINKAAEQGQSPQMAEGIAGNWQGKLQQALYTLGLLGSAGAATAMYGTVTGGNMAVIGILLLMFANTFFGEAPGQTGAMGKFGNKGTSTQRGLDDYGNPVQNMNVDENVLASQLRRQVSMEESVKVEQNLLNLYRTFGK